MPSSIKFLNGNLRPDELEAYRQDLAQKAALLATMPTLKEMEENWPLFLKWELENGGVESPPSLRHAFDEGGIEGHLIEYFQFWTRVQSYYLTVLTNQEGMTMEGVVDGVWRPADKFRAYEV